MKKSRKIFMLLMIVFVVMSVPMTASAKTRVKRSRRPYKDVTVSSVDGRENYNAIMYARLHHGWDNLTRKKRSGVYLYPLKITTHREVMIFIGNMYPGKLSVSAGDYSNQPATSEYVCRKFVELSRNLIPAEAYIFNWTGNGEIMTRADLARCAKIFVNFDRGYLSPLR